MRQLTDSFFAYKLTRIVNHGPAVHKAPARHSWGARSSAASSQLLGCLTYSVSSTLGSLPGTLAHNTSLLT